MLIVCLQTQTHETLANVSQELKDFQMEFKEEQIRADTEKHNMNKDIETLKNYLSDKLWVTFHHSDLSDISSVLF